MARLPIDTKYIHASTQQFESFHSTSIDPSRGGCVLSVTLPYYYLIISFPNQHPILPIKMRTTRKLSEQTQQSGSHAQSARHRQHRDPRSATESLGISSDATLNHRVFPLHLSLSLTLTYALVQRSSISPA